MTEAEERARVLSGIDRLLLGAGQMSFSAGEVSVEEADILALVDEASSPTQDPSRWASARAEFDAFLATVTEDLTHVAVLREGLGRQRVVAWVSWSGSTVQVVGARARAAEHRRHALALGAGVRRRMKRLRLLTTTAAAAARLASVSAVPGAGMLALPVAYRYVRAMARQYRSGQDDDPLDDKR